MLNNKEITFTSTDPEKLDMNITAYQPYRFLCLRLLFYFRLQTCASRKILFLSSVHLKPMKVMCLL